MTPRKMDQREEHHRIEDPRSGLTLFVRRLPSPGTVQGRPVLYVHGATFPSALSVAHRFPDGSWRDALCAAGLDVWALDFLGFGLSDREPAMAQPADRSRPLLLAADAARQLEAALRYIHEVTHGACVSLLTHSWGSMPACLVAGRHSDLIDKLVLFGPIARRDPPRYLPRPDGPAWRVITAQAQWDRFVEDVPPEQPPVLSRSEFGDWAERYLDTDPNSRTRDPQGVRVPSGPFVEILRAWHGELPYDPALIRSPVCIIRGEWDGLVTDADARWLFDAFSGSPDRRDIKLGRGTHLMHLEAGRRALWQASAACLSEPVPA
jgi:pimeloyl-ACP methyl ester carboxylesterase